MSDSNKVVASSGIGLGGMLFLVLLTLRLTGIYHASTFVIVGSLFAPTLAAFAIVGVLFVIAIVGYTIGAAIDGLSRGKKVTR